MTMGPESARKMAAECYCRRTDQRVKRRTSEKGMVTGGLEPVSSPTSQLLPHPRPFSHSSVGVGVGLEPVSSPTAQPLPCNSSAGVGVGVVVVCVCNILYTNKQVVNLVLECSWSVYLVLLTDRDDLTY